MNSNWKKNKARAIYIDNTPTMTDQAGARDCDINVIVKQFNVHGQLPGSEKDPIYADFSELPQDYRDMLHQARDVERLRRNLPGELSNLPLDILAALTPDEVRAKLKPADKPADKEPAKPEGEPK